MAIVPFPPRHEDLSHDVSPDGKWAWRRDGSVQAGWDMNKIEMNLKFFEIELH